MSTTTESQPQRAMLSAEAELGIPSQPLTATPPFFQRVLSLFSRKASLPFQAFSVGYLGHGAPRGQSDVALDPPCGYGGISPPRLLARPAGTRPISRMSHDDEQEKTAASQHHGESRLGRADRPRRHRGGALRAVHHHAGSAGRVAR